MVRHDQLTVYNWQYTTDSTQLTVHNWEYTTDSTQLTAPVQNWQLQYTTDSTQLIEYLHHLSQSILVYKKYKLSISK